ncbi:MAG: hypothetical protein ACYDA9_05100 [Terriglobia bacterium]
MGESIMNGGAGLLAAAQAFKPIGHVVEMVVANIRWRQTLIAGQSDVFGRAIFIDARVVLVIAFTISW